MNNQTPLQPHEIELRLRMSKPVVLSAEEKLGLKSSLMEYIDFHQSGPTTTKTNTYHNLWARLSGVMAVFVVSIVSAGIFAQQSLPGEQLYQFKLSVVEPVMLTFQYPTLDTMSEQTKLMERRLAEVQQLKIEGGLDLESSTEVLENLTAYCKILKNTSSVPTSQSLQSFDTAIALLNAHDALFETIGTSNATSSLDVLSDDLEEAQSNQIDTLLKQNSSSTIAVYINQSLSDIKDKISSQKYTTSTLEKVGDSIDEAVNSLSVESLQRTQEHIAEVNQLILEEDYLNERVTDEVQ